MKNLTVNVGPKTFPKYTPDHYLDIENLIQLYPVEKKYTYIKKADAC